MILRIQFTAIFKHLSREMSICMQGAGQVTLSAIHGKLADLGLSYLPVSDYLYIWVRKGDVNVALSLLFCLYLNDFITPRPGTD